MQALELDSFPVTLSLGEAEVTLRPMTADDHALMLRFAQSLPEHDLLFMRRDIKRPEEIDAWLAEIATGEASTLLAMSEGEIVGYSAVARNRLNWMRHVAELRVLVAPEMRRLGLGRVLTTAAFRIAVDMGVEKMIAQMTPDQEGAIGVFYRLGFEFEARLRGHVKDREGRTYDLIVMGQDVSDYQQARSRHAAGR